MKNILLIFLVLLCIQCKKNENGKSDSPVSFSGDFSINAGPCLAEADSVQIKDIVHEMQVAYQEDDTTSLKTFVTGEVIKHYSYTQLKSALRESMHSKDIRYEFRPDDKNGQCGDFNVLFVRAEMVEEEGEQYFSETTIAFLFRMKEGKPQVVNLIFGG
ncbi:hypothetical protein [Sinomicrobium oceani]|uniref:hypothetical protein n=1 Tax=Sinomicrobium oceani TaxID=1150368 RepID=UPI00227C994E|nr:hypothetical protein [Sinomicrobium oceani]